MAFHRQTLPTYLGGLPAGFDYINNPPLNGDPGAAAPTDVKKSSGVNEGTYFVAFGEDATASNTNRGLNTLSENCDLLDDVTSGPRTVVTTLDATAGGAIASLVITGDIWVGSPTDSPATANDQRTRDAIVHVLDQDDNEIEVSGTRVKALLIHDGASVNVVGQEATGFRTNPTVNFTPSIQPGTNYRLVYQTGSSLRSLVVDKVSSDTLEQVRFAGRVSGEVRAIFRELHAPFSAQAWDAAWDSTIQALAGGGLNEKYRRHTGVPSSYTLNTPGDGAIILRDGIAPTSTLDTADSQADPLSAGWVVKSGNSRGTGAIPSGSSGPTGFVAYDSRRSVLGAVSNDDGEYLTQANFMSVWAHDLGGAVTDARTQVTPTLTAVLNPGGALLTTVDLNVADFFHVGSRTSVWTGGDLLEVTRNSGDVEMYLITQLNTGNARRAILSNLNGFNTTAFTADENVTVRWVSMLFHQGAELANFTQAVSGGTQRWRSFFHAVPPFLTNTPGGGGEALGLPAYFGGNSITDPAAGAVGAPAALEWGGFNDDASGVATSDYAVNGRLYSDGLVEGTMYRRAVTDLDIAHGGITTKAWDPRQEGSILTMRFTLALDHTLTLSFAATYTPTDGDELTIFIEQDISAAAPDGDITWPASFVFSGADAITTKGVSYVDKYDAIYEANTGAGAGRWYLTKATYAP